MIILPILGLLLGVWLFHTDIKDYKSERQKGYGGIWFWGFSKAIGLIIVSLFAMILMLTGQW
jgi:uncharacterized membrane protein YidH (DUF202 family)